MVDHFWWAYFDDRQNYLRDVAGSAFEPTTYLGQYVMMTRG